MKKKTILIIVICVLAILIIGGSIYYFGFYRNQDKGNDSSIVGEQEQSKLSVVYDELTKNNLYTFTISVDDENNITTVISGEKGYKETIINGQSTKYIVSDGSTYLLQENTKRYYKYDNNQMILSEITNILEELKNEEFQTGKEKIDGKNYKYEEYTGCQDFLINNDLYTDNESNAKTRFYYDGDELKYIKTIVGDQEELAKIEITYNADDSLFNIPADYKDAENS